MKKEKKNEYTLTQTNEEIMNASKEAKKKIFGFIFSCSLLWLIVFCKVHEFFRIVFVHSFFIIPLCDCSGWIGETKTDMHDVSLHRKR